jgi:general secretion pathway protein H
MKTFRESSRYGSTYSRCRAQSGFTLIEIMVVLVIIGVMASTVVLSIRTDKRAEHMEVEMQRIQALLKMAREEAVMQNQEMALRVGEDSYSFEILGDKGWQAITDDKLFRERKVVEGTELALKVDNLEINFGQQQAAVGDDKIPPPRIYILSSGEIMPFELILRTHDQTLQYSLKAEQDGTVTLTTPEEGVS